MLQKLYGFMFDSYYFVKTCWRKWLNADVTLLIFLSTISMLFVLVFLNIHLPTYVSKWIFWCSNHVFCCAVIRHGQAFSPIYRFSLSDGTIVSAHTKSKLVRSPATNEPQLYMSLHILQRYPLPSRTARYVCQHFNCFVSTYVGICVFNLIAMVHFMNLHDYLFVIFDPLLTVSCLIRLHVRAVSRNTLFLVLTSPVNDHTLKSHCHVRTSKHVFPEADVGL